MLNLYKNTFLLNNQLLKHSKKIPVYYIYIYIYLFFLLFCIPQYNIYNADILTELTEKALKMNFWKTIQNYALNQIMYPTPSNLIKHSLTTFYSTKFIQRKFDSTNLFHEIQRNLLIYDNNILINLQSCLNVKENDFGKWSRLLMFAILEIKIWNYE